MKIFVKILVRQTRKHLGKIGKPKPATDIYYRYQ